MTAPLLDPEESIVIPMLTRVWPVPTQREPVLAELNLGTARMVSGTRVVLASVADTGSAWR